MAKSTPRPSSSIQAALEDWFAARARLPPSQNRHAVWLTETSTRRLNALRKKREQQVQRGEALSPLADQLGKWCLFVPWSEVDTHWERVRQAVRRGRFLSAKVSTALSSSNYPRAVICVATADWRDQADMMAARAVLRELGYTEELGYKRDLETRNRVYGTEEEWYLRA